MSSCFVSRVCPPRMLSAWMRRICLAAWEQWEPQFDDDAKLLTCPNSPGFENLSFYTIRNDDIHNAGHHVLSRVVVRSFALLDMRVTSGADEMNFNDAIEKVAGTKQYHVIQIIVTMTNTSLQSLLCIFLCHWFRYKTSQCYGTNLLPTTRM